jgi:uncharacterized lipoprotein YajG
MVFPKLSVIAIAAFLISGCSTNPVTLSYDPALVPAKQTTSLPVVEVNSVTDWRENTSNRIGAIRGGYGNPLKKLTTTVPVKDVVREAFTEGLRARGLLAEGHKGSYGLNIDVKRLDSSQLVRREAHSKFDISVIETVSGKQIYSRTAEDNRSDEGGNGAGILASVDDLRKITNESLQAAIDQALDDMGFLAAINAH